MDFWEKLLLQLVGPLVTAVVGPLIIGTFVARITRKAQERRADHQLHEERIRTQNQLRLQLIGQMTETASSLYIATQNFWRKKHVEQEGCARVAWPVRRILALNELHDVAVCVADQHTFGKAEGRLGKCHCVRRHPGEAARLCQPGDCVHLRAEQHGVPMPEIIRMRVAWRGAAIAWVQVLEEFDGGSRRTS